MAVLFGFGYAGLGFLSLVVFLMQTPLKTRFALRTVLIVVALLAPPTATAVITRLRYYPRRFATVIPGQLYRGGYPSAANVRHLQKDKRIRTILSLTGPVDTPQERQMLTTARSLGLRVLRVAMPGNGCGDFADLDKAADILNTAADRPIFFHCQAGKQRSSAALAAYRMRDCGWTLQQALKELEDHYGLDRQKEAILVRHLTDYARHLRSSGLTQRRRSVRRPGGSVSTARSISE